MVQKNIEDVLNQVLDNKMLIIQNYEDEEFEQLIGQFSSQFFDDTLKIDYPFKNMSDKKLESKKQKQNSAKKQFIKNIKEAKFTNLINQKDVENKRSISYKYCIAFGEYNQINYIGNSTNDLIIDKTFIEQLLEESKVAKKIINNLYKFSPFIDRDEAIEKKIKEYVEPTTNQKMKDKQKNNDINNSIEISNNTHKKSDNKIIKELRKERLVLKDENIILKGNNEKLKIENEQLKQKLENIENNSVNNLEYKSYDLNDSQKEIKKLSKDLERTRKQLDSLIDKNIKKLESKPELVKTYMELILDNNTASKMIVKALGIKEQLIQVGHKYYKKEFAEEKEQLEQIINDKEAIKSEINELESKKNKKNREIDDLNRVYNYLSNIPDKKNNDENIFKVDITPNKISEYTKKYEQQIIDLLDNDKNIILLKDRTLIDNLHCEEIGLPLCEVYPEANWSSVEDWFGRYNGQIFVPSKTHVADYYKIFENGTNLPFGLVIFNNFNKILPDFYLEPFVNMLSKEKAYNLININSNVIEPVYKSIKPNPKLKYILVESQDNYAFEIPISMIKCRITKE